MSHINNISFERISEEANGDVFSFITPENDPLSDLGLDFLFDDSNAFYIPVAGECDLANVAQTLVNSVEPSELDRYIGCLYPQNPSFECDNNRALMNNLPVQIIKKEKKLKSNTKQIELSQSVGVGLPQKPVKLFRKISIVHPLEEVFRPRYKSDYLSQKGKSRKPRYVADRIGNHYITLQVAVGLCGQIRVDWLTTPTESGDRYSMPYRFQQSNGPDVNPLYLDINPDKNGIMKLYLVLIKSKQDELKTLQPLKPFQPWKDAFGIPDKNPMQHQLNPKELIQKYQLDQSQLAFTFCAPNSNGKFLIPEWDTTVYSTILTEIAPDSAKQKQITCPSCAHRFPMPIKGGVTDQDSVYETVTNKRKEYPYANERIIKKQLSFENDLID